MLQVLKTEQFYNNFALPYILTYRSQLFSHIFCPKTRVRPIRWSYLSENSNLIKSEDSNLIKTLFEFSPANWRFQLIVKFSNKFF